MDYKVILSNGPDVIVRKKGRTCAMDLVLLFSQKKFFVLDEIANSKLDIYGESIIKNFFKDKTRKDIIIPKGSLAFCDFDIQKDDSDALYFLISGVKRNDCLSYLLNKNLVKINDRFTLRSLTQSNLNVLYGCDPKILKFLASYTDLMGITHNQINYIISVYRAFGYDGFRNIFKFGILPHFNCKEIRDLKPYNFNLSRFSEFVLSSGLCEECSSMDEYFDYLDMALEVDGLKTKYPESVASAHDKYATIISENRQMRKDYPEFASVMSECEDFSFEPAAQRFAIVMPQESREIVNEGIYLGHCVSSYVPKIISGECIILFMRKKEDKDTPYLTVEISKGRRLTEVEGENKRTRLTEEEVAFLRTFAKTKGIVIEAYNVLESDTESAA